MHTKISVIIPTYNAKANLAKTLDALVRQSLSGSQFEVIVVDDGSADGTDSLLGNYHGKLDISYYYMEDLGFRVSVARNIGIKAAKYPLVLFLDCGILASENLVKYHIDSHRNKSNQVTLGLSYGVEEFSMKNAKALSYVIESHGLETIFSQLSTRKQFYDCRYIELLKVDFCLVKCKYPWVICWGGNVSCEIAALNNIEGFDECFTQWGGEDVDLGIRLFEAGCEFQVLKTHEALHLPHFRSAETNQRSALENIKYIIDKKDTEGVNLLSELSWEKMLKVTSDMSLAVC
jgi:glycosyltransferase involved in cell wall biosynthesis